MSQITKFIECVGSIVNSPEFNPEMAMELNCKFFEWRMECVKQGVLNTGGTKSELRLDLLRFLSHNPTYTMDEVSRATGLPTWKIDKTLNLVKKLDKRISWEGVSLSKLYMLTKIPAHQQLEFHDKFGVEKMAEYTAKAVAAIKEAKQKV